MEEGGRVFVTWEEVVVSNDKGRRTVNYYLKDGGGDRHLAVVGKERSVRHMSYAVPGRFLRSLLVKPPVITSSSPSSSPSSPSAAVSLKWKTRREVIDWLSSLVSDPKSYGSSSPMVDRFSVDEDTEPSDIPIFKGLSSGKMAHLSKEFSWLGSSACNSRKRRIHYRSFCRNGITISVHDFVYVLSEDNRRLVAYVEDMYEDWRANRMVVVRWFHKVDEVAIVLPSDVNDREIFFSLCLQDFSVACIDGLASVLSIQHYEKFLNEGRTSNWQPYLCCRQINNDDIKPFDITQLQGYWSQELLRSLYKPSLKLRLKINCGGSSLDGNGSSHVLGGALPKKQLFCNDETGPLVASKVIRKSKNSAFGSKLEKHATNTTMSSLLLTKELFEQKVQDPYLSPGSQVELLSQDSGMRGCWFRCIIFKRRRDRVKVRYLDVRDADGVGDLEEWVLASRVASPDKLGIRLHGRRIIRPNPSPVEEGSFGLGSVVEAWWHDGWWEGVVILKDSEEKLHVYFPGEQCVSIFTPGDLRHSQDWVNNRWITLKARWDVASSVSAFLSNIQNKTVNGCIASIDADIGILAKSPPDEPCKLSPREVEGCNVPNLAEDCQLGLRWNSRMKRTRATKPPTKYFPASSRQKRAQDGSGSSSSSQEDTEFDSPRDSVLPNSENCKKGGELLPNSENCKKGGELLFKAPMAICSNGGESLYNAAPMAIC